MTSAALQQPAALAVAEPLRRAAHWRSSDVAVVHPPRECRGWWCALGPSPREASAALQDGRAGRRPVRRAQRVLPGRVRDVRRGGRGHGGAQRGAAGGEGLLRLPKPHRPGEFRGRAGAVGDPGRRAHGGAGGAAARPVRRGPRSPRAGGGGDQELAGGRRVQVHHHGADGSGAPIQQGAGLGRGAEGVPRGAVAGAARCVCPGLPGDGSAGQGAGASEEDGGGGRGRDADAAVPGVGWHGDGRAPRGGGGRDFPGPGRSLLLDAPDAHVARGGQDAHGPLRRGGRVAEGGDGDGCQVPGRAGERHHLRAAPGQAHGAAGAAAGCRGPGAPPAAAGARGRGGLCAGGERLCLGDPAAARCPHGRARRSEKCGRHRWRSRCQPAAEAGISHSCRVLRSSHAVESTHAWLLDDLTGLPRTGSKASQRGQAVWRNGAPAAANVS